nr:hypothetical protein FRC0137_01725 [Corynebacterium diphtheriae]CAB0870045.1 hypothetical protein FRC0375_01752 [Corynebacterium diphtheriae]
MQCLKPDSFGVSLLPCPPEYKTNEPAYKPDSVLTPDKRRSAAIIHLDETITGRLKQLPTNSGEQPSSVRADIPTETTVRPNALLPVGFT